MSSDKDVTIPPINYNSEHSTASPPSTQLASQKWSNQKSYAEVVKYIPTSQYLFITPNKNKLSDTSPTF
jgi:hypothetical protein